MMRPDPIDFDAAFASAAFWRHAAAIRAIPAGEASGTIPCPSCRRPLHYSFMQAGLKAHCETPNCTSFAE
ncbi:hypothetical protein [Mesorhizobium sp. M2A.F.Ca.ET.039.01.1.1]|uniref:hypothetical protein n=1 Tax=Mesorhizobium sp. M2A.F.Ca.ET.039.01.1.1 TaxID=2496746 RepID=UPI000FCA63B4|nr:hypothetical protein [Mesorhizobium sp. M2A.F.Ca.ET.039.01.1.1]RWX72537.1 hypothetical protein EOA24_00660 [Mesorhizobium sp. M2A.F.Ca.ET.039.01.1.1]